MKTILLQGDIPVNCYIIEDAGQCYIVDPGFEKERLINYVSDLSLDVIGIILTHAHFDHIGAIDAFEVPVYIHKEELIILNDGFKNGFSYEGRHMAFDMNKIDIIPITETTSLQLNAKPIDVIWTPGHTPGGICLKYKNDLITGDTLFKDSVGQWDFPNGNQTDLKDSIFSLIDQFDPATTIYPAHGQPSTIGHEIQSNMFIQHWKNTGHIFKGKNYKRFQEARVFLDNHQFNEAKLILEELIKLNDPNPLIHMYYHFINQKDS